MTAGLGPLPAAGRGFQRFFRQWGIKGNLRAVANWVQPVSVVDRYRGDEEGSLMAITGFSLGLPAVEREYASVIFGSTVEQCDVLLHGVAVWLSFGTNGADNAIFFGAETYMFTPTLGYDPVANLGPFGFFDTDLITAPSFTRGTVIMIGGHNPVPFAGNHSYTFSRGFNRPQMNRGHAFPPNVTSTSAATLNDRAQGGAWHRFDPPIRIVEGITTAIQWDHRGITPGAIANLECSILYSERRLST